MHNASAVVHDEQLVIEAHDRTNISKSAKGIVDKNEFHCVKPGAIKVENSISVPLQTTPAKIVYISFLKPLLKLVLKPTGFVYCEYPYCLCHRVHHCYPPDGDPSISYWE